MCFVSLTKIVNFEKSGSAGTNVIWQCWYHCQAAVLVPLSGGSAGTTVTRQ